MSKAKKVSFKREGVSRPPAGESWVWHTLSLMTSPAWRRRSDDLKILLDILEVEHMRHAGLENGNLLATFNDLVKAGIRRSNIAAAVKEGEALKLLVATRQGEDLTTGRRQPTRYRLTYLASRAVVEGRTEWSAPTDDWKHYQPPENGTTKSETRYRHRDSVGTAGGTRARRYFEEKSRKPSPTEGLVQGTTGDTAF
jgi:hypothetical protein